MKITLDMDQLKAAAASYSCDFLVDGHKWKALDEDIYFNIKDSMGEKIELGDIEIVLDFYMESEGQK